MEKLNEIFKTKFDTVSNITVKCDLHRYTASYGF